MGMTYIFGIDHGGVVVTVDQDGGIVNENLLHLKDQLRPLVGVHFALERAVQRVVFRVGICAVGAFACPVCHIGERIAGAHRSPVVVVQIVLACRQLAPLIIRGSVVRRAADADFGQILDMGVGKVVEQTVFIGNIPKIDILAVQLPDAVAVRIHDPGIVQNGHRRMRELTGQVGIGL